MGAYVLSHAVQNLKKILCPVSPIFDATILTAPDVDVDALENSDKLLPIHNLTKEIVVYVNKNDKTLSAAGNLLVESTNVQDGVPRMGLNGPGKKAYTKLGVPLTTIRCHDVDFDHMSHEEFGSGHWYYKRSITVIKGIRGTEER